MPRLIKHRCAVCWERQNSHAEWYAHATEQHGANLDDFGWRTCRAEESHGPCPGVDHAQRLPNFGTAHVKRAALAPQPYRASDGTTYTPVRLPLDGAA